MTRVTAIAPRIEDALSDQIIFLIGGAQPEHLNHLLGTYLGQPEVARVVLLTATPAVAARVAAPFADQREEGRLVTVVAGDDINGAIRAARRGWGEPDATVELPLERRTPAAAFAPPTMSIAAD